MMIRLVPIAVLMTLLLPPASYVATRTTSYTGGLLFCALAWLLAGLATGPKPYVVKKSEVYSLAMLAGLILLLTLHVVISNLTVGGVNFIRFFGSCLVLAVMVMSARFAARKLESVPVEQLVQTANLALAALTLIGIAAALGVPALGPQGSTEKAVVIFAEPSHFCLAYVPILMFRVSVAKPSTQALLTAMALGLALILESLTMVASVMLVVALLLRRTPLVLMMCVLAAAVVTLDLTYYSSRLVFSSESDNLSTLVLLQGWESAILGFQATSGIGVGFQQFGFAGPIGDIAEKVAELLGGEYTNLHDGGSTATKLIGEFGILGIAGILLFVRIALRGARYVRRSQSQPPQQRDVRVLFYYSYVIAFCIELFLRGIGYFSPGGFLALVALLSLASRKRVRSGTPPEFANAIGTTSIAT